MGKKEFANQQPTQKTLQEEEERNHEDVVQAERSQVQISQQPVSIPLERWMEAMPGF